MRASVHIRGERPAAVRLGPAAAAAILLLVVTWPGRVEAQMEEGSQWKMERGRALLEEGKKAGEPGKLRQAFAVFEEAAARDPHDHGLILHAALACYALLNVYEARKAADDALWALETGIRRAERAVRLNEQSSDGHRLLGEFYGRKIAYQGKASGVYWGPKSRKELLRALELDPGNARAHVGLGIWKLHTPRLFGGSREEAVAAFQQALELSPDSFEGHVWLGIAFRKQGRFEQAARMLRRALELSPENAWVRSELEKLPPEHSLR